MVAASALEWPRLLGNKKKLLPTSDPSTILSSTIVNEPIAGNIKFFSVSVPRLFDPSKHTEDCSNAACP